jgi:hypothetical protein
MVNGCPFAMRWGEHIPVPLAPQTIRQNWTPFLTFFLRRSFICNERQFNRVTKPPQNKWGWQREGNWGRERTERGGQQHTALRADDMVG